MWTCYPSTHVPDRSMLSCLPTKNAGNFLEACVLHLACTSVFFLCGFSATSQDGILNPNSIQIPVDGEPLLLKCRLSQYSVGAERCGLIHTLS